MTVNDITSHKYNAWQFYEHIPRTTDIVEAVREPLTLKELRNLTQPIIGGTIVTFDVALAHACVDSIIKRFHRRETLLPQERSELSQMIVDEFPHWSVCDLKCFEHLLIANKLATIGAGGQLETGLMNMDESSILGKMRVYDRMRPGSLTTYKTETVVAERPLREWQKHHLLNGMEYDFSIPYQDWLKGSLEPRGDPDINCERYWRDRPDPQHDEFDKEAIEAILERTSQRHMQEKGISIHF